MTPTPKPIDGRVATIIVTLPVRYRGGALIIRDPNSLDDSYEEIYRGGGKSHTSAQGHTGVGIDNLEWTAFLENCDYEVEEVTKGLRLTISYAVYVRSFGTGGIMPDLLITPSDQFLDLVAPILNICRGRKIALSGGQTCGTWANEFVSSVGGYLDNADNTSACKYCPYSVGEDFFLPVVIVPRTNLVPQSASTGWRMRTT